MMKYKLLLITIVTLAQIGLFIIAIDYVADIFFEEKRHDISMGISVKYFFYLFILATLLHNVFYFSKSWKPFSLYILSLSLGFAFLFLSGFIFNSRVYFVLVGQAVSILLPFYLLKFIPGRGEC